MDVKLSGARDDAAVGGPVLLLVAEPKDFKGPHSGTRNDSKRVTQPFESSAKPLESSNP